MSTSKETHSRRRPSLDQVRRNRPKIGITLSKENEEFLTQDFLRLNPKFKTGGNSKGYTGAINAIIDWYRDTEWV